VLSLNQTHNIMKNVLLLLAFIFSTNSFAQKQFNGVWKQDYSNTILTINLDTVEPNNITVYNPETNNIFYENIIQVKNNEMLVIAVFDDNSSYSCKYILKKPNELYCYMDDYILIYKKQ